MGKRGVDGAPSQISDNYFACPKFRRALRGVETANPTISGQFLQLFEDVALRKSL